MDILDGRGGRGPGWGYARSGFPPMAPGDFSPPPSSSGTTRFFFFVFFFFFFLVTGRVFGIHSRVPVGLSLDRRPLFSTSGAEEREKEDDNTERGEDGAKDDEEENAVEGEDDTTDDAESRFFSVFAFGCRVVVFFGTSRRFFAFRSSAALVFFVPFRFFPLLSPPRPFRTEVDEEMAEPIPGECRAVPDGGSDAEG